MDWIRRLMKKKEVKKSRVVVNPKDEGLAVFSYDGLGLGIRIGDKDIDTIFDAAKEAIKLQMKKREAEKDDEAGQEEG